MTDFETVFSGITRLGIDTAPFIYFVERHPVYLQPVQKIIRKIDAGMPQGYSSVITLTEVLTRPLHFHNAVDGGIASHAAELRSRYNLRTPDALQIAAVLSTGCDAFLTNDKKLKQITELRILVLDDLLPSRK
jgi:predicted nucleic acid-binding protein